VSAVYAEANYEEVDHKRLARELTVADTPPFNLSGLGRFTTGSWALVNLAYFDPIFAPAGEKRLIAFCGGDEDKLISELQRHELADRFVVVAASNSDVSQKNANDRAQSLRNFVPLEEHRIRRCHPHTAVGASLIIRELSASRTASHSVLLMPFSTKPHSLASAVASLSETRATMVARVPARYIPRGAGRTNRIWHYDIIDLTSPFAGTAL
jgi:hypothetical protein